MSKTVFLHFTDIHYNSIYDSAFMRRLTDKTGVNLTQQLVCGLEHMKRSCPQPEFVLISGDLVHEGKTVEYRALRSIIEGVFPETALYAAPGNHDSEEYSQGWLGDCAAGCYYEKLFPNALRLIALDSRGGEYGMGRIEYGQLLWLRDKLREDALTPTILMLHHTPHVSGEEDFLIWQMENAEELLDVVEGANIIGIFAGHTHMRYESIFGTIPCYTASSIGYEIDALEDRFILGNKTGYNVCEYENGVLDVRYVEITPKTEISVVVPYDEL
jgi:Predicted phosphohydrolases